MCDGMEMMVLSVLGPTLQCEWMLPTWKEAYMTAVSSRAMVHHTLRPGTPCTNDSSSLGARRRLGQDTTNTSL